jgi:hypothetical protein
MSVTQEQLEWIVAEVIRRLGAERQAVTNDDGVLAIGDELVTLATVEGRMNGVRSVRVTRRAVVTPAVRDELKKNGIELVRG